MTRARDSEEQSREHQNSGSDFTHKTSADFVCFVCGAVFATDEDRKQHLEKESHGKLHDDTTKQEMQIAQEQEDWEEKQKHAV